MDSKHRLIYDKVHKRGMWRNWWKSGEWSEERELIKVETVDILQGQELITKFYVRIES